MPKLKEAKVFQVALQKVHDESSFIQNLLIEALDWPIDPNVRTVEQITYEWDKDELRADGLEQKVVAGKVRQIALPNCPWGIFIVEFKNPDVFASGRGMTIPLRKVLAGLVPHQRKAAHLPSFFRENLLFICTHNYQHFRFVHFKNPGNTFKQPTLASFGWWPGDSTKTVCAYNLPHLAFLDANASVDDWLHTWTTAFDVERVTKNFYVDYQRIHTLFRDNLHGVPDAGERAWLASVLLNRLMFVYFLQKKGFLDGGDESYLEHKLAGTKGKDRFYAEFLSLLFFEGFAKPPEKRSDAATKKLGNIRYLNGGLFLPHAVEQRADKAGKTISLPDSVVHELFKLFASFSWNLNDKPGGQDNEINPDVLGYIVEKYINQKAFGAYYTRPEITGYLCERTIHRLILDAVNTPETVIASAKKAGIKTRDFANVGDLLKKLDPALATKLLDEVLPNMALLDPACGSGAFLVAAMKTLIDIYAAIYGWIEFKGSPELKARLKAARAKHTSLDYFIKKQIITDNLFGVDIMEEAVEIARLRLFLALAASANTVDELEPLPNIDFNILCGNSLIGLMHVDHKRADTTNKKGHLGGRLFQQKSYADVLVERNRELEMYRHFSAYSDDLTVLRDKISEINQQGQNTLDELLLADFEGLKIKFEQATWDDKKNGEGKAAKRPLQIEDIRELHPFHWGFAFDKVMARGGFDAIITNPPWEILKPNGKEFFEAYSDIVTKKSMRIHDFEKEQGKLLRDPEIRAAWLDYLSTYPHQSAYFHAAPEYRHQSSTMNGKKIGSDINLYKLFVERCFWLLRDQGQCGIIVPSGIYNDVGAKGLREMLFDQSLINGLFCFENSGSGIFENVHKSFKPTVLTFSKGGSTNAIVTAFMRTDVAELEVFPDHGGMRISRELIHDMSPDAFTIREFHAEIDLEIAEALFKRPLLGKDVSQKWKLSLYNELHMSGDSDVFETRPAKGRMPLFEGKMIHHFECDFEKPQYWVSRSDAIKKLTGSKRYPKNPWAFDRARFAHRSIGRSNDSRTLICSVIPPHAICGHSLNTDIGVSGGPETLFIQGVLSSLAFDFALRQQVSANLTMYFLYQTPAPRLGVGDSGFVEIVECAAKLICTTPAFDELAKAAGLIPPNHSGGVTDPADRARLRAKLDGMVAHLYGLSEPQYAHVLSTFPGVASDVKEAAMAEFKRLIDTGEAAIFNPDLGKVAMAVVVDPALAMRDLIKAGESAKVEFKSTARWDVKQSKPAPYIERVIVKTIAAFLNTDGGTLVIGVEDNGNVYGLVEDYKISGNKGRDGFELWLMQMLLKDFGKDAAGQIGLNFYDLDPTRPAGGGDVCMVSAKPSPLPRFVVENGQELFYIRTGNATNGLKPSEMIAYCKQKWPDAVGVG